MGWLSPTSAQGLYLGVYDYARRTCGCGLGLYATTMTVCWAVCLSVCYQHRSFCFRQRAPLLVRLITRQSIARGGVLSSGASGTIYSFVAYSYAARIQEIVGLLTQISLTTTFSNRRNVTSSVSG